MSARMTFSTRLYLTTEFQALKHQSLRMHIKYFPPRYATVTRAGPHHGMLPAVCRSEWTDEFGPQQRPLFFRNKPRQLLQHSAKAVGTVNYTQGRPSIHSFIHSLTRFNIYLAWVGVNAWSLGLRRIYAPGSPHEDGPDAASAYLPTTQPPAASACTPRAPDAEPPPPRGRRW